MPKETARELLNLPAEGVYLLFSVSNAFEKRKGMHHLDTALRYCMEDPLFSDKVRAGAIKFICFGDPGTWASEMGLPLTSLGRLGSERDLCTVYSAADVFLVPSIEDNLPNIVIEAMSCGTPTIAFDTGGIPDMIQNGVNGYIVPRGSEREYAKTIRDLAADPEQCAKMARQCRAVALDSFSLEKQARRYLDLYRSLLAENGPSTGSTAFPRAAQDGHEPLPDASDIDAGITRSFRLQALLITLKTVLITSKRMLARSWQ